MNKFFVLLAIVALSVAASAGTIPAGWTCTGNCGSLGADGDVTLGPSGSPYEWISTYNGIGGIGSYPGVGGGGAPPDVATNGTVLQSSTFTAGANDPLKFYFNYVTSDGGTYVDYAWVALVNAGTASQVLLFTARTTPGGNTVPGFGMPGVAPGVTLEPPSTPIIGSYPNGGPHWSPLAGSSGACWRDGCGYTGWIGSSYTIGDAGSYYLLFGVTNWNDTAYDSGLAIDSVTVHGNPIPGDDVPEPGTLVLLGTGLFGLAGAIRRKLRM